ncbi:hypothetical protein Dimus_017538 [Dionaea muscipula]
MLVQDEKLPKKLKPKRVKEAVVATSSISKSSPVKRTTPSQSRRSRSKTPLSPPRISTPKPIGAKDKQKAVADDVADDVADTSVKAAVVKVADVAAKIVHTPAVADLDVLVDKIVMDVAGMDVPKQDDVVRNELHTPDRCQIPNATDPGSVRSVRVVGEGRTDFNARSPSDKRAHEFLTRPYINITAEETNQITREQLNQFIADERDSSRSTTRVNGRYAHIDSYLIYLAKRMMHRGGSEYAITDSYFFKHVSELWQNWHRNFHEIPQHVVAYVSGIRPDWGFEWWKVRHVLAVCLVAQSHWVLADINLEKWTIEIYDSLAYKTPKSPGHRLASFCGYEDASSKYLRRG